MPCRPWEEASSLPLQYEQIGLLGPDGNWLYKRARLNQGGLVAVASPVAPRKFDGLTGSWSQAIVPRMRMTVAFNIMNTPVIGSPVMYELRRKAKEHCLDRRALLGYSSYDSDNYSYRSVQRKNASADRKVRGRMLHIDSVL